MKKRIAKTQLKKALVKAYGFNRSAIDIARDPKRPGLIVVTARFKDGSAPMVLRGRSLIEAASANPRLAAEFS